jgi:hypothetical protein
MVRVGDTVKVKKHKPGGRQTGWVRELAGKKGIVTYRYPDPSCLEFLVKFPKELKTLFPSGSTILHDGGNTDPENSSRWFNDEEVEITRLSIFTDIISDFNQRKDETYGDE